MKHRNFLCLLLVGLAAASSADTIKFKDGSSWTGEILSQSATDIVMSVELSGGAIKTQRTANRTDVSEIILSTSEEKLAQQEAAAYRQAMKNQLHPQSSYSKDMYDKVILGVFDQFLNTYTNSVHTAEIQALRAQWIAEREQVNAGQAKFRGEWKPVNEVRELMLQEQSRKALAEARAQMAQGKLDAAAQQVLPLTSTNYTPAIVSEATAFLSEVYKLQVPQWQQRLQQVQAEIPKVKSSLDAARREVEEATQKMNAATRSGSQMKSWENETTTRQGQDSRSRGQTRGTVTTEPAKPLGTYSQGQITAQSAVNAAKKNFAAIETSYSQLQKEEQMLQARLASTTTLLSRIGVAAPVAAVAEATPPAAPVEAKEEVKGDVVGIGGWLKKNWIFVLLGVGAVLYLMNRLSKN
jgi:hypothetical protein